MKIHCGLIVVGCKAASFALHHAEDRAAGSCSGSDDPAGFRGHGRTRVDQVQAHFICAFDCSTAVGRVSRPTTRLLAPRSAQCIALTGALASRTGTTRLALPLPQINVLMLALCEALLMTTCPQSLLRPHLATLKHSAEHHRCHQWPAVACLQFLYTIAQLLFCLIRSL